MSTEAAVLSARRVCCWHGGLLLRLHADLQELQIHSQVSAWSGDHALSAEYRCGPIVRAAEREPSPVYINCSNVRQEIFRTRPEAVLYCTEPYTNLSFQNRICKRYYMGIIRHSLKNTVDNL